MEAEKTVCVVTPSQILNIKPYLYCLLAEVIIIAFAQVSNRQAILLLLILPLGYAVYRWLQVRNTEMTLTDQRIILRKGIFRKTTHETELYRVRDSSIDEPFLFRIFGCGNILIHTTDDTHKMLRLDAIRKPHALKDQVRNYAEQCRQRKRWGTDHMLLQDLGE